MIDCGHKELKIGEKMLPLRCYPSHDETEKVYKVSGAEKNEKWKAVFVSFLHMPVQ